MRYVVFIIAYIYFLFEDFKKKKISTTALAIYAVVALMTAFITKKNISNGKLIDLIYSVGFGMIIYFLSYFSGEGIGFADGMYFVINGFLLTLKENVIIFFSGLLVAFIVGIFMFMFCKQKRKKDLRLPFMPCILPAIIGLIVCIV